jgi:hypothetical protein
MQRRNKQQLQPLKKPLMRQKVLKAKKVKLR